jgi:hypothetical protein
MFASMGKPAQDVWTGCHPEREEPVVRLLDAAPAEPERPDETKVLLGAIWGRYGSSG